MPASARPELPADGRPAWHDWVRRTVLFALLWLILTGGAPDSWVLGAPVVLVAAWLSFTLWAESPLSPAAVARFVPWFLYQSLVGATDVALRAMQPRMPLAPGLVHHRLRLPRGGSRVMLANVVSMLPGTLSADLDGDELVIHALDTGKDLHAMVADLEPRIGAIFRVPLEELPQREAGR